MGLYEFRSPTALGGTVQAWVYRHDLEWLWRQAEEASTWMSRPGRPVDMFPADILHVLVKTQKAQGILPLPAVRPERPGVQPAGERPAWSPRRRQGGY
jgi:hypothetical protein